MQKIFFSLLDLRQLPCSFIDTQTQFLVQNLVLYFEHVGHGIMKQQNGCREDSPSVLSKSCTFNRGGFSPPAPAASANCLFSTQKQKHYILSVQADMDLKV